jgi:flagellar protein FliO/FliZ
MSWAFWAGYVEKLAIVAFILVALYVLARRLGESRLFARPGRCVRLVESLVLSQHAALHVVRAGSRYFLIGSAAGGVTTLAELARSEAERNDRNETNGA